MGQQVSDGDVCQNSLTICSALKLLSIYKLNRTVHCIQSNRPPSTFQQSFSRWICNLHLFQNKTFGG